MFTAALVTIASVNFDLLVEFYTQLLASPPQAHIPHSYAEFLIAGLRLGLFYPQSGDRSPSAEFGHSSHSTISLCLEVDSLELAIDRLAQLGYPPPSPIIIAAHGREIYAYDPDGNRLILHQTHSTAK
jgi:hypothetical protein